MVRSNWLWNLSGRIQDYIIENQKIQKWMQGIKRSSSLKTKIEIDFGVPCLPVSFEAELKSDGTKLEVLIDWKVAMNYLKMDIEKIKLYKINDLTYRRTLGNFIFGVANIIVESSDTSLRSCKITKIRCAKQFLQELEEKVNQERKRVNVVYSETNLSK